MLKQPADTTLSLTHHAHFCKLKFTGTTNTESKMFIRTTYSQNGSLQTMDWNCAG